MDILLLKVSDLIRLYSTMQQNHLTIRIISEITRLGTDIQTADLSSKLELCEINKSLNKYYHLYNHGQS